MRHRKDDDQPYIWKKMMFHTNFTTLRRNKVNFELRLLPSKRWRRWKVDALACTVLELSLILTAAPGSCKDNILNLLRPWQYLAVHKHNNSRVWWDLSYNHHLALEKIFLQEFVTFVVIFKHLLPRQVVRDVLYSLEQLFQSLQVNTIFLHLELDVKTA